MAELIHYEGKLGVFDYDPDVFELDVFEFDTIDVVFFHYIGNETDGNRIVIPDGVVDCWRMFYDCRTLVTPPIIPKSVKCASGMFYGCESLVTPPVIPDGVKDCCEMFKYCESLVTPPVIPNGVVHCEEMFYGCESLVSAPTIPNSVKDCADEDYHGDMFYGCSAKVTTQGHWNLEHNGLDYYDYNVNGVYLPKFKEDVSKLSSEAIFNSLDSIQQYEIYKMIRSSYIVENVETWMIERDDLSYDLDDEQRMSIAKKVAEIFLDEGNSFVSNDEDKQIQAILLNVLAEYEREYSDLATV